MTAANVHGEVVGEGRTKGLKNRKDILRTTEPRLGLKGEGGILLSERELVNYVGDPDIHDATLLNLQQEDDSATVVIKGASGYEFAIYFTGVKSIKANHPENMILDVLAEMKTESPNRLFVFVNWDDEDDASLEIIASDLMVVERIDNTNAKKVRHQKLEEIYGINFDKTN